MKEKWIMALYLSMLMPTVFLTGCSESSAAATETVVESETIQEDAEETETDEETESDEMSEETAAAPLEDTEKGKKPDGVMVRVTSIEDGAVSGEVLEMSGPGKPDGDGRPSEKQGEVGTPPEKPDGDDHPSEGQREDGPPEKPDGDDQLQNESGGKAPEGRKPELSASGESVQFTITEETTITLDDRGETAEGTAGDITEDCVLEVVLDEEDQAVSIVIRK